jgi:hypothetical protein
MSGADDRSVAVRTAGWPPVSCAADAPAGQPDRPSPGHSHERHEAPGGDPPTERSAQADQDELTRLTERAGAIIGIASGVLGVLLAVGFAFLPVSTLLEKAFVVLACLALSVAAVTGIGAWRSARRFGITATSACVAVVCLAALSMAAQSDHLGSPAAGSSAGAGSGDNRSDETTLSGKPTPTTPTPDSSPSASPGRNRAAAPAASASSQGASVTVTGCGITGDGYAYANLSITNHTASESWFYVDVGFYQAGSQFAVNNTNPTIGAGSADQETVKSDALVPGRGTVSCKILQVNNA